ncbi:S-layer homology domain-containing protein [Intestinibacillus massiliensis]|uniref:S-layer homology domain-containing protein n=1 Tax=Intestinibacillus massiliensis TaxID=1871029 RepID=UPI000B352923|nr:S-layer homology domain-containing protein [Intestinibacillus massiliensis]
MKKLLKQALAFGLAAACLASGSAFAAAKQNPVNPDKPYLSAVMGTFHEQKVEEEAFRGQYSVYLPETLEQCATGVMVVVPDNTTAKVFMEGSTGSAWRKVCDQNGVAAVFVEAEGGKAWNVSGAADGRDEAAFLKKVSDNFHSKSKERDAAFNLNERAFYVVGYEAGGVAAQEFVMTWPALICGAAAVGSDAVPDALIGKIGDAYGYPFVQAGNLEGVEDNKLANKDIPVPVWLVNQADGNDTMEKYWAAANGASAGAANDWAARTYANRDKGQQRVWVTDSGSASKVTPEVLYTEFLSGVQRFVGDPGGRLEWRIQHTNNGKTGFFYSEEKVDGKLRRWYTYVPSSYEKGKDVPLVMAIHGYSSAIHAFTGDSRWQDVAEKNGFIVVFPQAYVNDFPTRGEVLAPVWHTYSYPLTETATDDVSFLQQLVEKTEKDYSIDSSRVYATGHSNGATMTWALGIDAAGLFAAIAPVGHNSGAYRGAPANNNMEPTDVLSDTTPEKESDLLLPTWMFKGDHDVDGGAGFDNANLGGVNTNKMALQHWNTRNGTDATAPKTEKDGSGRYTTTTYTNTAGDAPLVRYTVVENSPHAYIPYEADMIWDDFFSKYSRGEDGALYYEGKPVEKTAAVQQGFTDITNHWAKDAIQKAVDAGLFTGTSATTFSPEGTVTRGMAVTVLGRMAGADASGTAAFADVAKDAYYNGYIAWAVKEGVVKGTSATTFEPEADVTREQLAVMLASYAKAGAADRAALSGFTDANRVSDWAADGMSYCVGQKLITGKDAATLDPQGLLTRAELATILLRVSK